MSEVRSFERKVFNLKALDVDTKKKQVKVAIAELETVDRDEDLFDPSAFDKTIKDNGPGGSNEIWHLLDHNKTSFSALSKFTELTREGKYIAGVSNYKNSFAWREVAWPLYEAGDITQHSVGFKTVREQKQKAGYNLIQEVKLFEGSAVLWGANWNTPTMQVVKGLLNLEDDRDITAAEKIEEIIGKYKDGRYDEEKKSLLIVELTRLQSLFDTKNIKDLFEQNESEQKATEPEVEATQPEGNEENLLLTYEGLKTINNKFKKR